MKKALPAIFFISLLLFISSCKKEKKSPEANDASYSMLSLDYGIPVRDQGPPGACVAYASTSALEYNIRHTLGENKEINPQDLIIDAGGVEKKEGYILFSEKSYTWAFMSEFEIQWALADGFEGYTLTRSPFFITFDDRMAKPEEIKKAILQYGGVCAGINISTPEYFNTFCYYHSKGEIDHEVLIIGWDDNYKKENFGGHASSDGAWLAQNSFGDEWGDHGYCWISYESNIQLISSYQVSNRYKDVISYAAGVDYRNDGINTGEDTYIGNVYDHSGMIGGVGTYLGFTEEKLSLSPCSVTVEICSADFSSVIYRQEASFSLPGYYVVEFPEDIKVDGPFSVVVIYHDGNYVAVEGESNEYYTVQSHYITSINKGESFVRINEEWRDLSDPATLEELGLQKEPRNPCVTVLFR